MEDTVKRRGPGRPIGTRIRRRRHNLRTQLELCRLDAIAIIGGRVDPEAIAMVMLDRIERALEEDDVNG